MRIVIDTSPLASGHKTRGIGRYTRNLVEALTAVSREHQIIQTSQVDSVDSPDVIHYPYFDLFHSHIPIIPPGAKEVVTVHDLIPLRYPRSFKPGLRSGFNLWLQSNLIKRVAAVITDSQSSKKDIEEFLSLKDNRIHVVPLGVDPSFHPQSQNELLAVRQKYSLPNKFVLYVGDINVNKNIPELVAAVASVPGVNLVIVSAALADLKLTEAGKIRQAIDQHRMRQRVTLLTNVPLDPSRDLVGIYGAAEAYVQPSLYEGFGLPVLEAMACGTPVICSNAASLPEVAADAAILTPPTAISMAANMKQLLVDKRLQQTMRERGFQRARQLTWHNTARRTLQVYEQVFHG